MTDKDILIKQINNYYEAWFTINNIYSIWARKHGMQETTLFVLYVIKNTSTYCTQNEICNKLILPKQTVSLILSKLEKDGYIIREPNCQDRRNKIVKFTEKGIEFATPILEELKSMEIKAFSSMSEDERVHTTESFNLLSKLLYKNLIK